MYIYICTCIFSEKNNILDYIIIIQAKIELQCKPKMDYRVIFQRIYRI